jgi:hypothetical protein
MRGSDGTALSDRDPLAGRSRGFCVLKNSEKRPHQVEGFAGLQGTPVGQTIENVQRKNTQEDD